MTTSAPHLNGSWRGGGAKVASTPTVPPTARARFASGKENGDQGEGSKGECERRDVQAAIERDSPVGFSGVSTQHKSFFPLGYSSSSLMTDCASRSQPLRTSKRGSLDSPHGPPLAIAGRPRVTHGSRGSPQ